MESGYLWGFQVYLGSISVVDKFLKMIRRQVVRELEERVQEDWGR